MFINMVGDYSLSSGNGNVRTNKFISIRDTDGEFKIAFNLIQNKYMFSSQADVLRFLLTHCNHEDYQQIKSDNLEVLKDHEFKREAYMIFRASNFIRRFYKFLSNPNVPLGRIRKYCRKGLKELDFTGNEKELKGMKYVLVSDERLFSLRIKIINMMNERKNLDEVIRTIPMKSVEVGIYEGIEGVKKYLE